MIYKRVTIALILLAIVMAGALALLKNRELLSAQYKRCATLTAQADKLISEKQYDSAIEKYRQALMIDSKNKTLWKKFLDAIEKRDHEKCLAEKTIQSPIQKETPATVTPRAPIPQPSQPSFIIEEDEGC